jgi:acetyl esterase/lipase
VYTRVDGQSLALDIALPAHDGKPDPLVVLIHGGAWRAGSRKSMDYLLREFARRGYACAAVSYRLSPRAQFPQPLHDVKAAVRFLRRQAGPLQIDTARVGAMGYSAGAHLALMLGLTGPADGLEGVVDSIKSSASSSADSLPNSSSVQAVVSYFAPTDLTLESHSLARKLIGDFVGVPFRGNEPRYARASPVSYVHADAPPILLLHGTADEIVPYTHALSMAERMQRAGATGRVELVIGAGHGGWPEPQSAHAREAMFRFFDEMLGD